MCPYPRAPQALAHRDTRFTSEQGDGSTESRPHFIVRVTSFKDAYYLISSYTINHNPMLHYTGALSGQRAMTTALVLEADGRRANGRWKRGSIQDEIKGDSLLSTWKDALKNAGVVLDFKPDLAARLLITLTGLKPHSPLSCHAPRLLRQGGREKARRGGQVPGCPRHDEAWPRAPERYLVRAFFGECSGNVRG